MAAPQAIRECGTVPESAFAIVNEDDLLLDSVTYSPTRREQRYTQSGEIRGIRLDQPEMTIAFSGKITGTGTTASSAVTHGVGVDVVTDFNNFAGGTAIHEHDAADGCVVFMNPVRTLSEDGAEMTFDFLHLPHAV